MTAAELFEQIEARGISINCVGGGLWHASVEIEKRQRPACFKPEYVLVWSVGATPAQAIKVLIAKLDHQALAAQQETITSENPELEAHCA